MRLTTNVIFTLSTLIACAPSHAQIFKFTREEMIKYTANNPFERFEDGRPKAPDALLEKCKDLSAEEVLAVLPGAKFPNQYEGNWQILHPEKKLVGRAVTAQFMPYRPDVDEISEADARARGLGRNANQRVIDLFENLGIARLFSNIQGPEPASGEFVPRLGAAEIDAVAGIGGALPHHASVVQVIPFNGAPTRVDADATAFAHREESWLIHVLGQWVERNQS